jgi:transcriptional regulator with XRE-family HTH domain
MAVTLTSSQIESLVKARQNAHLTQLELSNRSRVALRTVKDLEAGRRDSFNESTLIALCRELKVEYSELMAANHERLERPEPPITQNEKQSKAWASIRIYLILTILPLGLISSAYLLQKDGAEETSSIPRTDWIEFWQDSTNVDLKLHPHLYNPPWSGKDAIYVNYYQTNHSPYPDELLDVEIKWSYHFVEGSTPRYYISAFTEWNPDQEILLLTKQTLQGEGGNVFKFTVRSPQQLGKWRIRVFFASSFGPFSSFFGHPGDNQLGSPTLDRYMEIPLEVVPKQ